MKNKKSQIKRRKKSHGNGQKRQKLANKNHVHLVHLFQKYKAELNEIVSSMEIFELAAGLEELVDLIVVQSNLHAQQKVRNFTADNNGSISGDKLHYGDQ